MLTMSKTLITVAPTGAETAKSECPQLPTTLEELVETAQRCEAAGAGLIHVHIRDADHQPTWTVSGSGTRSRRCARRPPSSCSCPPVER